MSMLKNVALVAAGGGVGSVLRYALTMGATAIGLQPPMGTLAANTLGCMAGGMLLGAVPSLRSPGDPWRLLLLTGFLGGLTTFSALSMETVQLMRDNKLALASANIAGTLALGLSSVWLGLTIARAMWPSST